MLRKFLVLILIVALAALPLIIATQNLNADTKTHEDGYKTSTVATGGIDSQGIKYRAWADYFSELYRSAAVNTVKGEFEVVAYVAGGSNPADRDEKYTLKKRVWGLLGDELWIHHYDVTDWTGTNPYGYALCGGKLGQLTNKTEKWFATQED